MVDKPLIQRKLTLLDQKTMQKMVGFRNLVIHLYEKTDVEIVYGIYQNRLKDFDTFSKEILEYLASATAAP